MAEPRSHRSLSQGAILTTEELKKRFEISNFEPNSILRGAQLTIVGALRAFSNPSLFTSEHYKQAVVAVVAGIIIRLAVAVPVFGIKILLWILSFFVNFNTVTWDDTIVNGLDFIENYVLQLPFFLMTLMRHVTPTLDNLFMESLQWVDETYVTKHQNEDPSHLRPMYYPNLRLYPTRDGSTHSKSTAEAFTMFLMRRGKKAGISIIIFALSYIPYIGRLVLPAASFYTFNRAVGLGPAAVIFGTGIFLPRIYLVIFLQSYFTSRSLMRDLLEPYFSRIKFTKEQKKHWFHDREGLLFGFALGFYIFSKIPLLGVLVYGVAQASTAFLLTKITDPPPIPASSDGFAASQQQWRNKHDFLHLNMFNLDTLSTVKEADNSQTSTAGKPTAGNFSAADSSEPPPAYTEVQDVHRTSRGLKE